MAPSVTDQCKAVILRAVETDWDSKLSSLKAEYDGKRQEIQHRYQEEERKKMHELQKARESELSLLQREYQKEVQAAKVKHAKGLMADITNELLETIHDPSEGVQTPSSCTLSLMDSSPGEFSDRTSQKVRQQTRTIVPRFLTAEQDGQEAEQLDDIGSSKLSLSPNQAPLPDVYSTRKDVISNEPSNAVSFHLSLHQRKPDNTWSISKRKRAEMVGSNDSSNNDGFVDSSTGGSSDEDIPAHPGRSSKYKRQYDTSSPAVRRASKMKFASISGTTHDHRQPQRWLAPSFQVQDSPPSGQSAASVEEHDDYIGDNAANTEPVSSTDSGGSQGVRRNLARGARPKEGVLKMKAPPRLRRP